VEDPEADLKVIVKEADPEVEVDGLKAIAWARARAVDTQLPATMAAWV
jgi:hypothetical protein